MSTLVIPNVFVNGTTINAAPFNSNFGAITTWSTAIDNTNIGAAGLFANQLLPTTGAQATFGPTATGVGYTFLANDATATPLTASGVSGQSAPMFLVTATSGGVGLLTVDKSGFTVFGPIQGAPNNSAAVMIYNDGLTTNGLVFNVPTGSTDGYRWSLNNSTTLMQITATAALALNGGILGSAGDLGISRTASGGVSYYGTALATCGQYDYGLTTAGKWSLMFDASAPSYAPVNGGAYTNASDAAFKSNIVPIQSGTVEIMALKPSSFTVNNTGAQGLGFIAQDVQGVLPELVSADGNGMLGVCYDGIIPVLVKHCQEEVAIRQQMQAALKAAGIAGF